MNPNLIHDPWKIIELGFDPQQQEASESIFSLGNGKMGHRGNFEEYYSGPSLQGSYIGGVYYPDKTKVGWWKNGYPEYFAKVINAPDWRGIKITVDGEKLDLFTAEISDFRRELDMRSGYLYKTYRAKLKNGKEVKVESWRFVSLVNDELGAIKYVFTPLNSDLKIELLLDVDADVSNRDSNYGEKFWTEVEKAASPYPYVVAETKKTLFHVCTAFGSNIKINAEEKEFNRKNITREKYVGVLYEFELQKSDILTIEKFAAVTSSLNYAKGQELKKAAFGHLEYARQKGFDALLASHKEAWEKKWDESDIVIKGDVAAQQGIRFCIYHLNQTYTGTDERLNIGPKGFTGEKYGGVTYWDTEAYCLPFYLSTADKQVARNLLIYRYKHLPKAIENAEKLGFTNGAALYPMVTINGEECHNEWEITFEEIHRNGAMAYAIYNYIRYNNEPEYLAQYGLEVLIGISRFWAQRVNWSEDKQKYVILGVTGPNEYENNVNNNWYTNKIAVWTLQYTLKAIDFVKQNYPDDYKRIVEKTGFNINETGKWNDIIEKMYFPYDSRRKVFLQQDGFLDKELKPASAIPENERPISQHWSWDRILRSCYIKQADVLQGLFFFEDEYDTDTLKRNFDFYEPMTVHESSLSPSIYSIIASKIGNRDKAYELYLRTARLDLDDYNKEVHQGLHITSMSGSWMSIVYGFGGMRVKDDTLSFEPFLPEKWDGFSFQVRFRSWLLKINVSKDKITIENQSSTELQIILYDEKVSLKPGKIHDFKLRNKDLKVNA